MLYTYKVIRDLITYWLSGTSEKRLIIAELEIKQFSNINVPSAISDTLELYVFEINFLNRRQLKYLHLNTYYCNSTIYHTSNIEILIGVIRGPSNISIINVKLVMVINMHPQK